MTEQEFAVEWARLVALCGDPGTPEQRLARANVLYLAVEHRLFGDLRQAIQSLAVESAMVHLPTVSQVLKYMPVVRPNAALWKGLQGDDLHHWKMAHDDAYREQNRAEWEAASQAFLESPEYAELMKIWRESRCLLIRRLPSK